MITLDDRTLFSLNQLLLQKSKKAYSFDPVWLVVRNAFPLWSLKDYQMNKKMIKVPENNTFRQVWLICDRTSIGTPGIMKLA